MKTDDSIIFKETGLSKMIYAQFKLILPSFIESFLNPVFFKWNLSWMRGLLLLCLEIQNRPFPQSKRLREVLIKKN